VPTYETIFITPPNLTEEDERSTVEAMAQVITDGGGSIVANDRMGRRRLAYPIRKFDDGVYIRLLYDSDAEVIRELERRFRLSDNVLRYLTVHMQPDWAEWSKEDAAREAKRKIEAEAAAKAKAEEEARAAAEAEAKAAEDAAAAEAAPDADAASAEQPAAAAPADDPQAKTPDAGEPEPAAASDAAESTSEK
jgi:small subunit ribosomal protein S6